MAQRKKPAPTKGLVLPDPGLHIAVLGALLDSGAVEADTIEAALEGIEGEEDIDRLREGIRRLHALGLDPMAVARIDALDFDGGNEIYMTLERGADVYTGGEDDTYSLRSLEGSAALSALERLDLDGHGYREETLDLRPLARHPALADLTLSGTCAGAAALETLPKLARLDMRLGEVDDPAVLDRLRARGVEIVGKDALNI